MVILSIPDVADFQSVERIQLEPGRIISPIRNHLEKDIPMTSTAYFDPSLPIETRLADLLGRMTLTEKCAQLIGPFGLDEGDGQVSLDFLRQHFKNGISYINTHHRNRRTRQTVLSLNTVQRFLREETRLGIPALGIGEGLHGYMAHEATSFPKPSV